MQSFKKVKCEHLCETFILVGVIELGHGKSSKTSFITLVQSEVCCFYFQPTRVIFGKKISRRPWP